MLYNVWAPSCTVALRNVHLAVRLFFFLPQYQVLLHRSVVSNSDECTTPAIEEIPKWRVERVGDVELVRVRWEGVSHVSMWQG